MSTNKPYETTGSGPSTASLVDTTTKQGSGKLSDLAGEVTEAALDQVTGGSITRSIDKSSPLLFQNACAGSASSGT
jgi:type VI protein secretion system component Hcp